MPVVRPRAQVLCGKPEDQPGLERGRGRALSSNKIKTYSVLKQHYIGFSNKIKTYSVLKQHYIGFSNKIKDCSALKQHNVGFSNKIKTYSVFKTVFCR
jgi:hypothetical protein